ncbi:hypothetical protein KP509_24G000100 [Ceratopteris richardii]|uniref:Uncharacterized protein n=1 Tax=Ceratopteris richardii TaxID=49495 RepID=A0A8T2RUP2_CERRI|nr:hypothetical protein KP509_24G000100 [Ceratopteris richardii]KAH7299208.1 hypothetical protein KP509_24G000100 [Ceratopteris richardii]
MSNLGFPMLSGKEGYSINSGPQKSVLLRIRPILEQAIATQQLTLRDPSHRKSTIKLNRNLDMGNSVLEGEVEVGNAAIRTAAFVTDVQHDKDRGNFDARVFRIADMGSSCGPNCLANMQFMVEAIRKYERQAASSASAFSSTETRMESPQVPIHLQAFFCDLPSNDFNTLFLHRQNDYYHLNEDAGCFTAAVAGTVYGRLFPPLSLHLVFSSCCLHWLSHSPKLVSTQGCTEWNKGKIWVDGPLSNKAAGKAYAEQWNKDFMAFLKSRYEEMVEGGMMFLIIPCRDDSLPPHQMQRDSCFRNLEISWQQLTKEVDFDAKSPKNDDIQSTI